MNKTIFVTGGSGFIGSHLVELLVQKGFKTKVLVPYNIHNNADWLDILDNEIKKNIEVYFGDITDPHSIQKYTKKVDVLINLAALISIPYSYETPISYVNTNIIGTLNCLEATKKNNISQMIQASTSEVYGTAIKIPISETHPLNAQSPYAATKISSDQLALSYSRSFDLPVSIIRPFNTFGPRQSMRAVLPNIFNAVSENNNEYIKIKLGNINARRDFTYVIDTAYGFINSINNSKTYGDVINLGTGYDFSIKEIIGIIEKITKKKIIVTKDHNRIRPKKSEIMRLLADNSKAKKILRWKPKYSGKNGIKKAIQLSLKWYASEKNRFKCQFDYYHK